MMRFVDFSPPPTPSLDQQRDALQKGLGRTWTWALSGKLADAPLLEACLSDQRFDQQCEDSRSNWLWKIVRRTESENRFRSAVFDAFNRLPDEWSANQLCEIAYRYAEAGDQPFRSRLYEIVERKPVVDSPWLGERQIIALDGTEAFLFAARVRGERLATIDAEWDDGSLADDAIELFGEDRIVSLMSASTDPGIKRFYENWREEALTTSARTQSHRDRMRSLSTDDILIEANGEDACLWFRGWGMHANESELRSILSALWAADDPKVISRLLRVFSNRSLPRFDLRLIDLCQHDDKRVQRAAFKALSGNADAAIRKFAIQELASEATGAVISLFQRNFESGDEERILESLSLPDDPSELHWLLMDVIKVLEFNSEADASKLAVVAYGSTPCQNCRFDAARLLLRQEAAPAWLIKECRFDAEERTRKLFEEPASE